VTRPTFILLLLILPLAVVCQKQISKKNQIKADSIIAYFLSEEVFMRYVKPQGMCLEIIRFNNHVVHKSETLIRYNFKHPKFSNKTFEISFVLDSCGRLIVDEPNPPVKGLIRIDSLNETNWISAEQAINICSDQSYRLKKKSLRLTWDSNNVSYDTYLKTGNFRDIVPGELVWEIDGKVEFRGDIYSGTFQVNAVTGLVSRLFAIPWD
jgi:hypothetical protein